MDVKRYWWVTISPIKRELDSDLDSILSDIRALSNQKIVPFYQKPEKKPVSNCHESGGEDFFHYDEETEITNKNESKSDDSSTQAMTKNQNEGQELSKNGKIAKKSFFQRLICSNFYGNTDDKSKKEESSNLLTLDSENFIDNESHSLVRDESKTNFDSESVNYPTSLHDSNNNYVSIEEEGHEYFSHNKENDISNYEDSKINASRQETFYEKKYYYYYQKDNVSRSDDLYLMRGNSFDKNVLEKLKYSRDHSSNSSHNIAKNQFFSNDKVYDSCTPNKNIDNGIVYEEYIQYGDLGLNFTEDNSVTFITPVRKSFPRGGYLSPPPKGLSRFDDPPSGFKGGFLNGKTRQIIQKKRVNKFCNF